MPSINVSDTSDQEFRPLLQYYVYVLIDPRDDNVFYVGEGQNDRGLDHVDEVKRLIKDGATLESSKHQKIKNILDNNLEPKTVVVARFEKQDQAFAVESVMINFVYDYKVLTNAVRGHGAEFVRQYADFSLVPGLDIPMRIRCQDGSYTNERIEALNAAGAFDLLERIRHQLTKIGFLHRDFTQGTSDKAFDPSAGNGWVGLLIHIHGVDFLLSFSATCKPALSVANTLGTRNAYAYEGLALIEKVMGPMFHIGIPKNKAVKGEGRYRDFESLDDTLPDQSAVTSKPTFDPDNLERMYELLDEFKTILDRPSLP